MPRRATCAKTIERYNSATITPAAVSHCCRGSPPSDTSIKTLPMKARAAHARKNPASTLTQGLTAFPDQGGRCNENALYEFRSIECLSWVMSGRSKRYLGYKRSAMPTDAGAVRLNPNFSYNFVAPPSAIRLTYADLGAVLRRCCINRVMI